MPIHPAVSARFHHLEGITSFREAFSNPAQREQIHQFDSWDPETAPPVVTTTTNSVPGPHGPVPVRIYGPAGGSTTGRPALVWAHGGGFLGGDLDMREADWTAREVSRRAGAIVVSVDYRLAVNDVHFPVPHDDVVATISWTRDHAENLGIDPTQLSVGGASAGGNLAAGAVLRLRDRDGWLPAGLVLAYPTLHPVIPSLSPGLTTALREVPQLLRMTPADAMHLHTNYLGGPPSSANGYAMPGIAVVDGLCPTLILNAEYDDLRASGEAFTASLARAGVDVRQVTVRGMLHAFLNLPAELGPVGHSLDLIAETIGAPPVDRT